MIKSLKYIFFIICFSIVLFLMLNDNSASNAQSLWQIEGTTVIAYNGNETIINVPEGMTKIGPGAFSQNNKINKVILPNTVKEIGMRAFAGCTNLADINIENIEKIGEVAFEGTVIQEVVFSDKITEIPIGCFAYSSVKKVTLGKNVTTISSSAFYDCRSLQEVNLSDCLLSIGSQAFYKNAELKYIYLPEGLSIIGSQAFSNSGLEEVNIPGTVETLNSGTFSYCTNLKEIVFNEGLKEIGGSLIYDSLVKTVNIPSTVEEIGIFAFAAVNTLKEINVDINNKYFDSDNGILYTENYEKVLMIPYGHQDKVISLHDGVKDSEEQFAANLKNVEKVIIPEGFITLNHNAFSYSNKLEEVVLPNSLEVILSGAFAYCSSLYSVNLPNNLKELSTSDWWIGVFAGCSSLKEIVIPDSVEKIGPYTFQNCTNLERVVYPANLVDFGYKQFSECANLKEIIVKEGNPFAYTKDGIYYEIIDGVSVLSLYPSKKEGKVFTIPENVTSIGNNAFDSAYYLEEIIIPEYVTSMGTNVFSNTKSLKKAVINANISVLPNFSFSQSSVSEVILPSTLIELGRSSFMQTENLKTITIPYGVEIIGDMSFYNSGLTEIELPDSVTTIGQAFYYAINLKEIKLSNSITTFTASSFNHCPIEEIVIPNSMVEIEEYSFVDCYELRSVFIPDSVAIIHSTSFTDCPSLIELTITENNKYFVEIDGILYNEDKTSIVFINQERLSEVIVLPDTLKEIGYAVFKNNQIIKEITIPASVERINYNSFEGAQIEKAIIGEGTKILPNFLFQDCTKLKEVILPESLEKIDGSAFGGCTSLESFEIPDSVCIDTGFSLFRDCVNLKSVKLPSTMKIIPQYIFAGCISLEEVIIPYGVEEIETHFVQGCNNIKTIVIPETVTALEYDAFADSSVEKVIFLGDAPSLISSIFGDVFFPSNVEIYVFKNAKGFSDKSYKPYIKQFKYLADDVFKNETNVEVISLGEHNILIEVDTIYASLYKYYVKNEQGEYELIEESTDSQYNYKVNVGNKKYEFKVEILIQKDKLVYTTILFDDVYISKTYDEYLLDFLIFEMISISYKNNPSYEELDNVLNQYNSLNETYKQMVNAQVNIDTLQNKYNELKSYKDDIEKITSISLSIENGNTIFVGESTKLVVLFPDGVVNKNIEIDVDKVGVIDIKEDGTIYAIKEGKVKIKVTALSGASDEIELTVNKIENPEPDPNPNPEPDLKPSPEPVIDKNKNCSCKSKDLILNVFAMMVLLGGCYILIGRGGKNA